MWGLTDKGEARTHAQTHTYTHTDTQTHTRANTQTHTHTDARARTRPNANSLQYKRRLDPPNNKQKSSLSCLGRVGNVD